jgi:hypothetical protein
MVATGSVPGVLRPGIHSARPAATAVAAGTVYFCSTHGVIDQSDGATWTTIFYGIPGGQVGALEAMLGGSGSVIATGPAVDIYVPFACTITGGVLLADVSGSIVVDVFKSTYTAYDPTTHPASSDKITASAPLTISAAKKSKDTTLTGWTVALAADDVLRFNVNSASTITRCTAALLFTRP